MSGLPSCQSTLPSRSIAVRQLMIARCSLPSVQWTWTKSTSGRPSPSRSPIRAYLLP